MIEVKAVEKTMVCQVDEHVQQSRRQIVAKRRQKLSANTLNLSQQQIHEIMQVIEEIRLKGYQETL